MSWLVTSGVWLSSVNSKKLIDSKGKPVSITYEPAGRPKQEFNIIPIDVREITENGRTFDSLIAKDMNGNEIHLNVKFVSKVVIPEEIVEKQPEPVKQEEKKEEIKQVEEVKPKEEIKQEVKTEEVVEKPAEVAPTEKKVEVQNPGIITKINSAIASKSLIKVTYNKKEAGKIIVKEYKVKPDHIGTAEYMGKPFVALHCSNPGSDKIFFLKLLSITDVEILDSGEESQATTQQPIEEIRKIFREAIQNQLDVELTYTKTGETPKSKILSPIQLDPDESMVIADTETGKARPHRLDRMTNVKPGIKPQENSPRYIDYGNPENVYTKTQDIDEKIGILTESIGSKSKLQAMYEKLDKTKSLLVFTPLLLKPNAEVNGQSFYGVSAKVDGMDKNVTLDLMRMESLSKVSEKKETPLAQTETATSPAEETKTIVSDADFRNANWKWPDLSKEQKERWNLGTINAALENSRFIMVDNGITEDQAVKPVTLNTADGSYSLSAIDQNGKAKEYNIYDFQMNIRGDLKNF